MSEVRIDPDYEVSGDAMRCRPDVADRFKRVDRVVAQIGIERARQEEDRIVALLAARIATDTDTEVSTAEVAVRDIAEHGPESVHLHLLVPTMRSTFPAVRNLMDRIGPDRELEVMRAGFPTMMSALVQLVAAEDRARSRGKGLT